MDKLKALLRKPAAWAVIIFIVLFVWGLVDAQAATFEGTVGVGYGSSHDSSLVVEQLGVRYDRAWQVSVTRTGNEPRLEDTWVWALERRVAWREDRAFEPFLSFGAAYWRDRPARFVDDNLTFALAAGVSYRRAVELVWQHYSTSGRTSPNWGVDYIMLRATMEVR